MTSRRLLMIDNGFGDQIRDWLNRRNGVTLTQTARQNLVRTVNRGNFGRIWDVCIFFASANEFFDLGSFLPVRQCLEEENCKFLLSTAWHTTRNQASCSVQIYPGKWGKFGQPQNLHTNPYSEILWFLKFQNKALYDVFFCTRRVQWPHKWTHQKCSGKLSCYFGYFNV